MKRTISFFMGGLVLLTLFRFCGCTNTETPLREQECYFSFTGMDAAESDVLEASVFQYDFTDHTISSVYQFPVSAMYALGVYDKGTNSVFYVKEANNNSSVRKRTGDEIFVRDLSTGAETQLTNDLLAVNHLIPVDNILFFIAARQSNPYSLVLGRIDLTSGEIQYWDEPETISTRLISVDRQQKRVYVALYNVLEEDQTMIEGEGRTPTHTICSYDYDLKNKEVVLEKEAMAVKALDASDNFLFYTAVSSSLSTAPGITTTQKIDLRTGDILFETEDYFPGGTCLSKDQKGLYVLTSVNDLEGIYYFDLETQTYSLVTDCGPDVVINYQLLYS